MDARERTLLEKLKRRLATRLPINRVVLYGSRARGDAEPDSDMDVLVVLDKTVDRESERYVRLSAWELSFENGIVLVPITVFRDDWDEGLLSASTLAAAVRREGIAI